MGRAAKLSMWPSAIGNGLAAGAVGTAFMTVSTTIEMRLRSRPPSDVPARAAAKVLGMQPTGEAAQKRFATLVDWGYGTGWGAVRGLIGALGLEGRSACLLFFCEVWGSELVMLPALDIGVPPVWRWGGEEVAIDALHHVVYATATSLAYERLERASRI
jgi:hypothetical protein